MKYAFFPGTKTSNDALMRPMLTLLWCMGTMLAMYGQNLVPNASFEDYETCPPYPGQIHLAQYWDSPNNLTTDYFHACAPPSDGASVPENLLGRQTPHSGLAYAGIRTWLPIIPGNPPYREYLAVQLQEPLQKDQRYEVQFWVSVAEKSHYLSDDIGLFLSEVPFGLAPIYDLTPIVRQPEGLILDNKETWTRISGAYQARGGEAYLMIGNVLPDSLITLEKVKVDEPAVYYYIDDVFVQPCPDDPEALPPIDTLLCAGEQMALRGLPGAMAYAWSTGGADSILRVEESGRYEVESFYNCYSVKQVFEVQFQPCPCQLSMPTFLVQYQDRSG